jgi:hypothetical protein
MSKTSLEFFATPEEQRHWLRGLLSDERIWCVVGKSPPNRTIEQVTGTRFLNELHLTKPGEIGGLQLFFGPGDLVSSPIWRTSERGDRDIDFARSKAVLFDPSFVVRKQILLEGTMAIMRRVYYEEAGIDPKPLQRWFRQIANSFTKLKTAGTVVLRDPADGTEKAYPDIIATPGAVEWQRTGHLLKQFVNGAYEFEVR